MMDDDWEIAYPSNALKTKNLLLVGRTGNGKSATGNSILGRNAFKSRTSSFGVTITCELQSMVRKDGQVINVIDTPGLFDVSLRPESVGSKIFKCIDFAKEGIHAFLVVLSVRTPFSKEEEAALESLYHFFGSKIVDYMILVFTGGDELELDDETLEGYLDRECPTSLKEMLVRCGNRQILFDNKTKDAKKKAEQVEELVSVVNMIMAHNNGKPYSNKLLEEMKEGAIKFRDQQEELASQKGFKQEISELYEQQTRRITEMVDSRLKETTRRLESQLAKDVVQVDSRVKETTRRLESQLAKDVVQVDSRVKETTMRLESQLAKDVVQVDSRVKETTRRLESQLAKDVEQVDSRVKETTRRLESQLAKDVVQVDSRHKETTGRLERQLAKEQAARLEAERRAKLAQQISNDEIRKLRKQLECAIL